MAPTEILAEQHYSTLSSMLAPLGVRIGRLTGAMSAKEKRETKAKLKAGEYDIVVGTHALFSQDVEYSNLALVVTDEQHRFGVGQRSALIGKGQKPHVLVMSATPIPRTLALIIYGDLDVSLTSCRRVGRRWTPSPSMRATGSGSTALSVSLSARGGRCSSSARWSRKMRSCR